MPDCLELAAENLDRRQPLNQRVAKVATPLSTSIRLGGGGPVGPQRLPQPESQKKRRWTFHHRLFLRAVRASASAKVYKKFWCYKRRYGLIQRNNN